MDQNVKAQWVAALRSGEYKQASGYLKSKDGFCCLGVLSDMYAKEKNLKWTPPSSAWRPGEMILGADTYPADPILEWCGFPDVSIVPGFKDRDNKPVYLTHLNDWGTSFNQIADLIEYFY